MRLRRVVTYAATIFLAGLFAFSAYLGFLYRDLSRAFIQKDEFVPTRIYSDVSRIAPPQPRSHVEERLKSLGYSVERFDDALTAVLRPVDYPARLIPEDHPVLHGENQPVTFRFDSHGLNALLVSVELAERELPDLYLEPELVATLARGGAEGGSQKVRELVAFHDIPANIWKAIIAIEDQHFLDHKGLDPRGIARAIWVNLRTRSLSQGGSTITAQLVKNLTARRGKNIFRKFNELFLALLLESSFEKEQILERYLNEVYLGQSGNLEIHGIAEGAEYFFAKRLNELNLAEIALMAAVIRGPSYYSPYNHRERAFERMRLVLHKMVETNQIAEAEERAALALPVRLAPPQTVTNKAPYFTDFVKAELVDKLKDKIHEQEIPQAGFRVYTTLDLPMNTAAQQAVAQGVATLEARLPRKKATPEQTNHRLEGALAAVDHSSGFIRALVGGRGYAQSTFNRILNMKRQVGSTFKPVVYLAALLKGEDPEGIPYGPGYPMEDANWTLVYDQGRQTWSPRNYEKEFLDWIPLRTALAHSVNTVTAKLGWRVGIPNVVNTAKALGIKSDLPAVPSLSLGVAELSPIELLRIYATIANSGLDEELTVIRLITQNDGAEQTRPEHGPNQAIAPGAADLITEMLRSVFTDGTAREAIRMGFDRPAAGKTGTTSHHRDAWFAGYTPQLTAVVWVGMDQSTLPTQENKKDPQLFIKLTGAGAALPIWVNFMKTALSGEPPITFPISSHLIDLVIDEHTGRPATAHCPVSQVHTEKYIRGHDKAKPSCEPMFPSSKQ